MQYIHKYLAKVGVSLQVVTEATDPGRPPKKARVEPELRQEAPVNAAQAKNAAKPTLRETA